MAMRMQIGCLSEICAAYDKTNWIGGGTFFLNLGPPERKYIRMAIPNSNPAIFPHNAQEFEISPKKVTDMELNMVADMEVDKVADMVADIKKNWQRHQH